MRRQPNADLTLDDLVASATALGFRVDIQLEPKGETMHAPEGNTPTDWFEPGTLPARSGVYEVQTNTPGKTRYRYFDGIGTWYYGDDTPRKALASFQQLGVVVSATKWRGLAERAE